MGRIRSEFKAAEYFHQDAVEWTFPPTIDGGYLHFAGITREPNMVHDLVPGADEYCPQFLIYDGIIHQEWVASVGDPLAVGWSYNEVPKVSLVNHDIDPGTGMFSVTTRINDHALADLRELSLSVQSRVTAEPDNRCASGDYYSQISVVSGSIPDELKLAEHHHQDAIKWTDLPTITGSRLQFAGRAEPGSIHLESREGYCGQFSLYELDEAGYHHIVSLYPLLPDNFEWTTTPPAELVEGRTYTDGTFRATASLSSDLLSRYPEMILVVRTAAKADEATNRCGHSDVLSAIDVTTK